MKLSNIGAKRISLFLKDIVVDEVFEKFSFILNPNITLEEIIQQEENYIPKTYIEKIIWNDVFYNDISKVCLELSAFYNNCIYAQDIFQFLGEPQSEGITLHIASLISGQDNSTLMLQAYNTISKILSIKKYSSDIDKIVFYIDFSLEHLINTDNYIPSMNLKPYIDTSFIHSNEYYLPLWNDAINSTFDSIFDIENAVAIVYGEQSSGRRTLVKDLVHSNEYNLISVDYKFFVCNNTSELNLKIANIIRDCYLLQAVLCISNVSYIQDNYLEVQKSMDTIKNIIVEYSKLELPIFITATPNVSIIPYLDYPCYSFTIPKLSPSKSSMCWEYFSKIYQAPKDNRFNTISKMIILPIGKIQNVVYTSISQGIYNDKHKVAEMCYSLLDDKSFKGANKIYPKYTWDDLKLPKKEKDTLQQICAYVQYKDTIMEDFKMANSYQYGSCASALFTGPPGTGKTMSAHVIANALNLALYRVDLSQIIDKYVGETEKHLNDIFQYAENSNVVLFFDEADAIIGKRSEISDAKDKYNNTQVSYILQRIEEYNGIVLMATNFSNNIDSAIMRRIRYVVNFQLPNSEIREEIWRATLNDNVPYKDLDFKLLSSDDFEFSGAMIKNIVLNSVVLAVSEGSPVTMNHIAQSIRMEYLKSNRTILPPSIQPYL